MISVISPRTKSQVILPNKDEIITIWDSNIFKRNNLLLKMVCC